MICSHNLYQIKTLCEEAIWLRGGRPQSQGDAVKVVEDYGRYLGQASAPRDGGADDAGSDPSLNCRIESLPTTERFGIRMPELQDRRDLATGDHRRVRVRLPGPSQPSGGDPERRRPHPPRTRTRSIEELQFVGGGRYRGRLTLREIPLLAGGYRVSGCRVLSFGGAGAEELEVCSVQRALPGKGLGGGPDGASLERRFLTAGLPEGRFPTAPPEDGRLETAPPRNGGQDCPLLCPFL